MELLLIIVVVVLLLLVVTAAANAHISSEEERKLAIASGKENVKKALEEATGSGFVPEQELAEQDGKFIIAVDSSNKQWLLAFGKCPTPIVYSFSDLISYEVIEDGQEIVSSNAGNAAVGGILFGTVGAVVGAAGKREVTKTCNDLHIEITVNNIDSPLHILHIISGEEIQRDSDEYKHKISLARSILSLLAFVKANAEEKPSAAAQPKIEAPKQTVYDELEKLYDLKEKGIITEEEFQKKKESLLWI